MLQNLLPSDYYSVLVRENQTRPEQTIMTIESIRLGDVIVNIYWVFVGQKLGANFREIRKITNIAVAIITIP